MSRWGCASSATPATSTSVSPSTRCSSRSRRRSLRRSATNSPSSCDKRRSLPTLPPVREQGAGAGEPGQVTPRLGPKPTLRGARAPPAGPAERDPVNEQVPRRQVERRDAWATVPEETTIGKAARLRESERRPCCDRCGGNAAHGVACAPAGGCDPTDERRLGGH